MNDNDMRDLVRSMVEEILDEALRRDDYVNRLVSVGNGIMGEYFKARYAEANSFRRRSGVLGTSEGWDREVKHRIEFNFKQAVRKRIGGGDRRKAFDEAMDELRMDVSATLVWARYKVAEAFGLDESDMSDPVEDPTEELFAMLENAFEEEINRATKRR